MHSFCAKNKRPRHTLAALQYSAARRGRFHSQAPFTIQGGIAGMRLVSLQVRGRHRVRACGHCYLSHGRLIS